MTAKKMRLGQGHFLSQAQITRNQGTYFGEQIPTPDGATVQAPGQQASQAPIEATAQSMTTAHKAGTTGCQRHQTGHS